MGEICFEYGGKRYSISDQWYDMNCPALLPNGQYIVVDSWYTVKPALPSRMSQRKYLTKPAVLLYAKEI